MRPITPFGWSFQPDDEPPRLGPGAFTPDDVARLLSLRQRVQSGAVREDTPETKRMLFVRLMVWKGLFKR